MKSFENDVIVAFQDIAKEIGTEMRRNAKESYCVEIPGKGIVLRVYWEIDRNEVVFVTLFKEADIDRQSKEYSLGELVEFKDGSLAVFKEAANTGDSEAMIYAKLAKKYAMGYLLGIEKNFFEFEEYVKQKREQWRKERPLWKEMLKKLKHVRVRPEWIPEED